jgi:hypothetical protein
MFVYIIRDIYMDIWEGISFDTIPPSINNTSKGSRDTSVRDIWGLWVYHIWGYLSRIFDYGYVTCGSFIHFSPLLSTLLHLAIYSVR